MKRRNYIASIGSIGVIYKLYNSSQPSIATEVSFESNELELHEDTDVNNMNILLNFRSFNINSKNLQKDNSIDIEIKSGSDNLEIVKQISDINIPKNGVRDIASDINSIGIMNKELKEKLNNITKNDTINFDIQVLIQNEEIEPIKFKESFIINIIEPKKKAVINSSETIVEIDKNINFSAEDSETNSENVQYKWDFDDGTIKDGEKVTHSYSESGEYNVKLVMTDEEDVEYTDEITMNISIPSNLVGYWQFDEIDGDKLIDYSGNDNHGTIYGGITKGVEGHTEDELAYKYDGSSGYVTVPDVDGYDGGELTFTAWVNIETNNTSSIMDMHDYQDLGNDGSGKIHIEQNDSGYFRVTLKDDSSNNVINMRDGDLLSQNQWKFIVIRYDGTNAEVSYDGDIKDTDSGSGNVASQEDFQFGMHKKDRWFDGRMSEIRIYNEFLTDKQLENVREGETNV